MPINENFILKHVGKDFMIIPLSDGGMDFSKVYDVSETGARIFELLKEKKAPLEIAYKMVEEYEVAYDVVLKDIFEFIEELKKRGIYND
ncbi:MAG: PqqD family protein [Roseburia sp.]|nr:PqqD family protein [Anaeroplasma bactoclasticum]MCM1196937.1 PqqD family protein [Roseburia sp.]MCM1557472.1 PqqD family protein [Anaeroplasma bactoclasticum]